MKRNIESGECFTALMTFKNVDGNVISTQDNQNGKPRPIVVMKDPDDGIYYAYSVTSKIENVFNKRNGYVLQNHAEAGFRLPSLVKCNKDSTFEIDPNTLRKPFGKLTEQDLDGFLERLDQVRQREFANENEMER